MGKNLSKTRKQLNVRTEEQIETKTESNTQTKTESETETVTQTQPTLNSNEANISSSVEIVGTDNTIGTLNAIGQNITYNITHIKENEIKLKVTSFRLINSPSPNFTGRQAILNTIHSRLESCANNTKYNERIIVIHGLGGMGKSEIARKYAEMYMDDEIIQNVAWIDSKSETSLKSSFTAVAEKLLLENEHKNAEQIAKDVYVHFSNHITAGLFIFDNSQQMHNPDKFFGIYKYLPSQFLERLPLILITSRTKEWEIPRENIIGIADMDFMDAEQFLQKRFKLTEYSQIKPGDINAVSKLASSLQGYPLALSLAASNIIHDTWTNLSEEIDRYLERMNLSPHENPWIEDKNSGAIATSYELIMSNVWTATFERIQNGERFGMEALQLLNYMAYMSPDDIYMDNLGEIYQFISKKAVPKEAFSVLAKYSLISIHEQEIHDDDDEITKFQIRIHRLVQHCTRNKLEMEEDQTCLANYSRFITHPDKYVNLGEDHILSMISYLKNGYWKKDIIYLQFSLILISTRIFEDRDDKAWDYLAQVYKFLKPDNDNSQMWDWDNELVSNFGDDFMNLFYLCLNSYSYCEKDGVSYSNRIIYKDPQISLDKLKLVFKEFTTPTFEWLLCSQIDKPESMLEYGVRHCYRTYFTSLYNTVEGEEKEEAFELLLQLIDSFGGGRMDTYSHLSYLLQKHFDEKEDKCDSDRYLNALLKIHFSVYRTIDLSSKEQVTKYWMIDVEDPYEPDIIYYQFYERLQNDDFTERSENLKLVHGSINIIAQYLHYYVEYDSDSNFVFTPVYLILRCLQLTDSSLEAIRTGDFMKCFYGFTVCIFKQHQDASSAFSIFERLWIRLLWCLLVWFALFERNQTIEDNSGVQWSVRSISAELKYFLSTNSEIRSQIRKLYSWELEKIEKYIPTQALREFIKSTENEENQETRIASNAAVEILAMYELREKKSC